MLDHSLNADIFSVELTLQSAVVACTIIANEALSLFCAWPVICTVR